MQCESRLTFLKRLIDRFGDLRVIVTDKLRSYLKPIKELCPGADHRRTRDQTLGLKDRAGRRKNAKS